ncbi:hypothetical protein HK405_013402 [Cladochytrium tenue]|nr:hypothetical protein HK405_013402 [Cladochytrium tenue]
MTRQRRSAIALLLVIVFTIYSVAQAAPISTSALASSALRIDCDPSDAHSLDFCVEIHSVDAGDGRTSLKRRDPARRPAPTTRDRTRGSAASITSARASNDAHKNAKDQAFGQADQQRRNAKEELERRKAEVERLKQYGGSAKEIERAQRKANGYEKHELRVGRKEADAAVRAIDKAVRNQDRAQTLPGVQPEAVVLGGQNLQRYDPRRKNAGIKDSDLNIKGLTSQGFESAKNDLRRTDRVRITGQEKAEYLTRSGKILEMDLKSKNPYSDADVERQRGIAYLKPGPQMGSKAAAALNRGRVERGKAAADLQDVRAVSDEIDRRRTGGATDDEIGRINAADKQQIDERASSAQYRQRQNRNQVTNAQAEVKKQESLAKSPVARKQDKAEAARRAQRAKDKVAEIQESQRNDPAAQLDSQVVRNYNTISQLPAYQQVSN